MKIFVKAKSRARKEGVEQLTQLTPGSDMSSERIVYRVSVKESPVDGKANEAIVRLLAEHFHTPAYNLRIISGQTSKDKIVEVDVED